MRAVARPSRRLAAGQVAWHWPQVKTPAPLSWRLNVPVARRRRRSQAPSAAPATAAGSSPARTRARLARWLIGITSSRRGERALVGGLGLVGELAAQRGTARRPGRRRPTSPAAWSGRRAGGSRPPRRAGWGGHTTSTTAAGGGSPGASGLVAAGGGKHPGDVGRRVVVGKQRAGQVAAPAGAVAAELAGGGVGGRADLVDVAGDAVAVVLPGRAGLAADAELHRPGRARRVGAGPHAGEGGAAVVRLVLADRGEHRPRQPWAVPGGVLVGAKVGGGDLRARGPAGGGSANRRPGCGGGRPGGKVDHAVVGEYAKADHGQRPPGRPSRLCPHADTRVGPRDNRPPPPGRPAPNQPRVRSGTWRISAPECGASIIRPPPT